MPAVCLNMIVKNEGAVIERCLAAVLPFIDSWCIVDTGSTDDTKEKIQAVLGHLPGELHERPWKDFGHNRTEALEIAKDWKGLEPGAYLLFMDADDTWTPEPGFAFPEAMDQDAYFVRLRLSGQSFKRLAVVRARKPWRYNNRDHAILVCPEGYTTAHLDGVLVQCRTDGAQRGARTFTQEREFYRKAALRFEEQLERDPGNLRAMFYCAQSYKDAGDYPRACHWYELRAAGGGWDEERWWALMRLASLRAHLGTPWPTVEAHYLEAYRLRPHRAEPLVALSRHCRVERDYAQAHLYACAARDLPYPHQDVLFVDDAAYAWEALDEYALSAYRVGKRDQAREANLELLAASGLPVDQRTRVFRNLAFCGERPADEPLSLKLGASAQRKREAFAELHELYTSTVSTPEMAASLEACALAYALCEAQHQIAGRPTVVLDLGSGVSSAVLRQGDWTVASVDTDEGWLDKTEAFLVERNLPSQAMWTTEQFFDYAPSGHWDFAFMDMDRSPDRARHLPGIWTKLRPGALMLIDDLHQDAYRARVSVFLASVRHERIDVEAATRDRFGRYSWLVRKVA